MNSRYFFHSATVILIIMGCVLLFAPKEWFPGFYSPVFMGVIALVSPVLIYLPQLILHKDTSRKSKLIHQMSSVIAFSLLLNFAGELGMYQLYKVGFEYDKFAHFLVPMLFAFILGEALKEWEHFSLRKRIAITFIIVFASGIVWEFFEFSSDMLFKTEEWGVYGEQVVVDTSKDIFFDALGAIAGIIIFMIPKKPSRKTLQNPKAIGK